MTGENGEIGEKTGQQKGQQNYDKKIVFSFELKIIMNPKQGWIEDGKGVGDVRSNRKER